MSRSDDGAPAKRLDRPQKGPTEPLIKVVKGAGWVRVGVVAILAMAAILAWDWSRKAFALSWPIVGVLVGATAGKLLGVRGERALSAWRAWAAREAVPTDASKQPDLETTTTGLGMFIGLTISFGLVDGWPRVIGMLAVLPLVWVVIPALGRWAGTSITKVSTIWLGSFLISAWYWNSIVYPAMPNRTLKVLGPSIVYACLLAGPFLWNLRSARRRTANNPGLQKPTGEGGPGSERPEMR